MRTVPLLELARAGADHARGLAVMSASYGSYVLPRVRQEVRAWRARAGVIPDGRLRAAALESLTEKRFSINGAALFTTVVPGRNPLPVRLHVAYQILCDYLDTITEWPVPRQIESARQLHVALEESFTLEAPLSDYYAHHPHKDDGGYLRALVHACRSACGSLPAYQQVRELVVRHARRYQVQSFNHDVDAARRTAALRLWAEQEFPGETEARWFELSGAAANNLHLHVLLALAADPRTTAREVDEATAAYFPSVALVATMLDSLVDREEDALRGHHSYVGYYDSAEDLTGRLTSFAGRSAAAARALRRGERHSVIVAGMTAMYLSQRTALAPDIRVIRRAILDASGASARVLLPVMRVWRAGGRWRASQAEGVRGRPYPQR